MSDILEFVKANLKKKNLTISKSKRFHRNIVTYPTVVK